MLRRKFIAVLGALPLIACSPTLRGPIGADGLPLPQVYRIGPDDQAEVKFRMVDGVNALRQSAGLASVQLDARLTAAAATHARDMALQNRPWLFGSDGSSPLDRARRVGFEGKLLGENISETYETELQTLAAWMRQENTRSVILDPNARFLGFSWFQESNGKIWWAMNMGGYPV